MAANGPARRLDDARDAVSRAAALETAFRTIARTRMQGLPILHPRLAVQAVGFAPHVGEHGAAAVGVLVTPWFMNLVRLPAGDALAVGAKGEREIGGRVFEFIGAQEAGVGAFEACPLFSPMNHFADQDAAVATARELLALLRLPVATATTHAPSRRADDATPAPADARPRAAAGSTPRAAAAAAAAVYAAPTADGLTPPVDAPEPRSGAPAAAAATAGTATPRDAAVAARRGFLFGRAPAARG